MVPRQHASGTTHQGRDVADGVDKMYPRTRAVVLRWGTRPPRNPGLLYGEDCGPGKLVGTTSLNTGQFFESQLAQRRRQHQQRTNTARARAAKTNGSSTSWSRR